MGRHRRIQSKNRKKLKSVDPFNLGENRIGLLREKESKRRNLKPDCLEQAVPKWSTEMNERIDSAAEKPKKSRKNKYKNGQMNVEGFIRHKWETDRQFLNRVRIETNAFVQEEEMKIKYDMADVKNPIGNLEEEISRAKSDAKAHVATVKAAVKPTFSTGRQSHDDVGDSSDDDEDGGHGVANASTSSAMIAENDSLPPKHKRKRKRKVEVDLLSRREIIGFGERVDAPPQLTAMPRKALLKQDKAGSKDLLLKSMMETEDFGLKMGSSLGHLNDGTIKCADPEKEKELRDERSRVIDLYRAMKTRKRT